MDQTPPDPTISVVIPAYRAAVTIGRALTSIAAQTVRPNQVVVVDDGSDDGTADAARACAPYMGGIELVVDSQANAGAGAARNQAVALATGDWVAFLDADDAWRADKVERALDALTQCSLDTVLISHDVVVHDGAHSVTIDCARHDVGDTDPFHPLYRRGYISTSTAMARRDAVLAAGGFDTTLANAQDFDLWLAMASVPGARVHVFPGAFTDHYNQEGSIQTHTARRLRCGLKIAARYRAELKRHPGSATASLLFRVVAVHAEAVAAHWQQRRIGAAAVTMVLLPVRAAVLTLGLLGAGAVPRPNKIPADAGK